MQDINHLRSSGKALGLWLVALAALVAGALLALTLRQPPAPPELSEGTTRLDAPRILKPFGLIDHTGTAFDLDRLRGQWTYLFFGYTHCPDICPTTMASLSAVARSIAALPEPPGAPQFVFVSIDPQRDTPERLAAFVPYFNPAFIGVTGATESVDGLTGQLSVAYLKVESGRPDGYLMDHTAAILLIDPQARLHALMSPPFDPQTLAQDFNKLQQHYEMTQ